MAEHGVLGVSMLLRIVYSLLLFPFAVAVIVMGGLPLKAVLVVASLGALYEAYKGIFTKLIPIHYLSFLAVVAYYFFIHQGISNFFVLFIGWIVINSGYQVVSHKNLTYEKSFTNIVLPMYIGVLFSTIYLVRDNNPFLVWAIFVGGWGCDTFAYFTGKFLGKNKLTTLSPNKTVEGFIGGIIGATILGALFALGFYTYFPQFSIDIILFTIICGVAAVFGQLGDLAASSIKRHHGIKDYGHIIPGHGGFMDRIDSLLFTGPVVYMAMVILNV